MQAHLTLCRSYSKEECPATIIAKHHAKHTEAACSHVKTLRTAGALPLLLCAAAPLLPAAAPLVPDGAAGDTCRRPSSTTVTLLAAAVSWGVRTRPPRPASRAATTRSSARISFVRALLAAKIGNHISVWRHAGLRLLEVASSARSAGGVTHILP